MKNISLLLCGSLLIIANAARADTLWVPGTITISTNETILITAFTASGGKPGLTLMLDGIDISLGIFNGSAYALTQVLALTGPHSLYVTNNGNFSPPFSSSITFQRITNSPIQTIVTTAGTTNFINVATGRTIQLFPPMENSESILVQPPGSTNWFTIPLYGSFNPSPSITGPATIAIAVGTGTTATALSYYFTDEVVQFPPSGLLTVPAPILEVNIEKSFDLTNWTPVATFHTDAEAKAFYRLKMLK